MMSTRLQNLVYSLIALVLFWWLFENVWDSFTHTAVETKVVVARGALAEEEVTTINIFKRVNPSVVYITTLQRMLDPWRRDVYNVPAGTGSGFVWDSKGHIVTNFHVIRGASAAKVRLNDNREYSAELIGASPENDLAVLRIKVEIRTPPSVAIGSSGDLLVGQKVFAIGNPFGLDYTLTSGIVSAINRSIPGDNGRLIDHLIQTDAAINPGNSGGPLIDSAGRVIGITTAIFSPSGASAGIGFAVPIDTVNRIVPQLILNGRYQPLSLGVSADDRINEFVKEKYNVSGVAVLAVEPNSISDQLGLIAANYSEKGFQLGDVLLSINNIKVLRVGDLRDALEVSHHDSLLNVEVWRNGKLITLEVGLAPLNN